MVNEEKADEDQENTDEEKRNAPRYFKVKKNGVKFFAIVSILSSLVMFASGICYLSKEEGEEEKEIKVLMKSFTRLWLFSG